MASFTIRGVLRTSFEVWKRNFLPFTLIAALCYAPELVLRLLMPSEDWDLYSIATTTLINALIASAVTYGVIMELQGTRPPAARSIARGLAQLGPALGVTVVSALAIIGGLLLFVVPGVIVLLMLFVAVPVAVTERLGVMAALHRSRELTHGHKWTLCWVYLILAILSYGLQMTLEDVLGGGTQAYVWFALDVTWGLFVAVVAAVAYTQLRQVKEGVQVPQLARAFARVRDGGS